MQDENTDVNMAIFDNTIQFTGINIIFLYCACIEENIQLRYIEL